MGENTVLSKEELLMNSLTSFYSENGGENMKIMRAITENNDVISLRILDYFATIYAKKHNVTLSQVNNLYTLYKSQLKGVTKEVFDPFRRRTRLNFYYNAENPEEFIETTIGQLMFFRWVIKNGILDYIREHFDEINASMFDYMRKRKRDQTIQKKRAAAEMEQEYTPKKKIKQEKPNQEKPNQETKKEEELSVQPPAAQPIVIPEAKEKINIEKRVKKKTTEMIITFK